MERLNPMVIEAAYVLQATLFMLGEPLRCAALAVHWRSGDAGLSFNFTSFGVVLMLADRPRHAGSGHIHTSF